MRDGSGVERLCERLAVHPGVALAAERARGLLEAARAALAGPLDGVAAGRVEALAERVVGSGRLAAALAR
jgi:hypothetical protein